MTRHTMNRRKLPIGIQSFAKIRSGDYYYVDKTALALELIDGGSHYFLSRPRRFGKSLFLDTLKELFEGNEPLFQGLAVHDQWDWSVNYPVLRFDFGQDRFNEPQSLQSSLCAQLTHLENQFGITPRYEGASNRFTDLIVRIHQTTGLPVVILADEFDKPIMDALPDEALARANNDNLCGFFGALKDHDAQVKFTFITGVVKFSRAGLFSGLNHLTDISLDSRYSTLCGYTDKDIDTTFAPELAGLNRQEIRDWYNGYSWLGEGVYNPFDILQLFDNRAFGNYWFETSTPTFLVDLLSKRQVNTSQLDNISSSRSMLSSFDVEQIVTEGLLFHTGYLTIKSTRRLGSTTFYILGYPNREVYKSLQGLAAD